MFRIRAATVFDYSIAGRIPDILVTTPSNGCHSVKKPLDILTKSTGFEWSSFQIVGTIAKAVAISRPLKTQTFSNLIFKKSRFGMVDFRSPLYLDGHTSHVTEKPLKFRTHLESGFWMLLVLGRLVQWGHLCYSIVTCK